jgi:sulfatase maturation enzyme AslB (radical SAM superfamily)
MNLPADYPYRDQPREVHVETFAFCNARCTFCPYPTLERQGEKMSGDLIEKIIQEMATFKVPFIFCPFKVNEPFLDKRLIPILQRVNEAVPKALLRIFTNGSALTPENVEQVASLQRVAELWISLNSHDPEEYERLMGLKFENTAKRIDMLHKSGFPWPVTLSCVGEPNEAFRSYCFSRWPKFTSRVLHKAAWLGYTESQRTEVPDKGCGRWFELSIMANGIVSLCCMDGTGQYAIGDVNKQTMLEIYNAPAFRKLRMDYESRRKAASPCNGCTY